MVDRKLVPVDINDHLHRMRLLDLFDDRFYRERAGLPAHADAALHYLESGWRIGFEPNSLFEGAFLLEGAFLRPFYEAADFHQAPALTWLELEAMGGPAPPATKRDAQELAEQVCASALFDAAWYGRHLPEHMNPALHYAIVGERMGWRPSSAFDPAFYLDRYPDVVEAGISPLRHYETVGKNEGRRPVSVADRLAFPLVVSDDRPVLLLISHDASRSGAPILGWNLARCLSSRYRIVSLLMHGGVLEPDFEAVASASVGPMTWDDWHPAETRRVAERLVSTYQPLYAIANSVVGHLMIPPLVLEGVPVVALVHEFAAYIRPLPRMKDAFYWARHILFPAHIVADSSFRAFQDLKTRTGLHVLPQGRANLPPREQTPLAAGVGSAPRLRSPGEEDIFVILGVGSVEIRKGVDLFISAAAAARRLRPEAKFRFVWVGHGYDPINDANYSCYLSEQIALSALGNTLAILPSVEDLDPLYAQADIFFISSRLDPQPNVGIDAVTRGIPTICFEKACGTAEILAADPETQHLVVPHLDAHMAANEICYLWDDRASLGDLRAAVARVGRSAYNMDAYVDQIDALGRNAATAIFPEDLEILRNSDAIDPMMLLPPGSEEFLPGGELERVAILRWQLWNTPEGSTVHPNFRRPCAGFHPQRYAQAHAVECLEGGRDPLAHWIRNGRPQGPWSREVFTPSAARPDFNAGGRAVRIALHAHFHYAELADGLRRRLARNASCVDLFLSTDSEEKAEQLRKTFRHHRGSVTVRTFVDRGRDIAPFLTGLADEIASGGYGMFGHVHGKGSLAVDGGIGDACRNFLWDNLIGAEHAMLDLAATAFAHKPSLGLLIAEDPHLVAWKNNRHLAEKLAARMGVATPLDDFFDFPHGSMFWARPSALRPLLNLRLSWDDYPEEPLPYDGTLLHALERLLPFVVRHVNFEVAGLRAPETTW
jgi:glycosyltransferase involved in cell wall biosynthesis